MPSLIEDYALIGDRHTAALVAKDGSIDWLCAPRFDSPACFAALLGGPEHGRWQIRPEGEVRSVRRRYLPGTLILETEIATDGGAIALIDFMPTRDGGPSLCRVVEGRKGRVPVRMELTIRFDYGSIVPWVRHAEGGVIAIGGPDGLVMRTPVAVRGEGFSTVAEFAVSEGQRVPFSLAWFGSHLPPPEPIDPEQALGDCRRAWEGWSSRCCPIGPWREPILRSLITLKALTYEPTGGIVAAPTTSLPEKIGGVRNWDYRICWLRDASFTLSALVRAGYLDEASAWREWLLRAVAGDPKKIQIMYGLEGRRRLTEMALPWLPGYEGSAPVRVGNGASEQVQLDVYGELAGTMYQCRKAGLTTSHEGWDLAQILYTALETRWKEPDEGIWEVRSGKRHFTHSKMMAWVAFDRAVRSIEEAHLPGPVDRWRTIRDEIHAEVCARGFDASQNAFVQSYGSDLLDASLLMMPHSGFLPASDPRVVGTVEAIRRGLMTGGLVRRYNSAGDEDGLPPGEGTFLPCTFWLVDCLAMQGLREEAVALFERLLSLCNDVGLLSEEYDTDARRMLGNFPQALSHIALVNSAFILQDTAPAPSP